MKCYMFALLFVLQDNSFTVYGGESNVYRENQVSGPEDSARTDKVDMGRSRCL